jgi:lipopolysaccharide/colanic/teichoic acid biosynthesis glycosyltransferase
MKAISAQGRRGREIGLSKASDWRLALKRGIDIVIAGAALLLLAPALLLIAALVRWASSGPALFRQPRIGFGGRRFDMWKFRAMKRGVPDDSHRKLIASVQYRAPNAAAAKEGQARPIYRLIDDPRITRFGRWLRRTSLRELPQLL